jgi:hypothetical protein
MQADESLTKLAQCMKIQFKKTEPVDDYGPVRSHSAWYGCFVNGHQLFHIHNDGTHWAAYTMKPGDEMPTGDPVFYIDTLRAAKDQIYRLLTYAFLNKLQ